MKLRDTSISVLVFKRRKTVLILSNDDRLLFEREQFRRVCHCGPHTHTRIQRFVDYLTEYHRVVDGTLYIRRFRFVFHLASWRTMAATTTTTNGASSVVYAQTFNPKRPRSSSRPMIRNA